MALLIKAKGGEVSLSEILALRIAQFGARILELRRMGFDIQNRTEQVNGVKHSWYRLVVAQQLPLLDLSEKCQYPD